MRVKRYVVDSMPDALQRIREDLGKDAVILNTKEVRSGGFLGLFGKKKIEVIAAIDSSASSAPPSPAIARPSYAAANPPAAKVSAPAMKETAAAGYSAAQSARLAQHQAVSVTATLEEPVLPPAPTPEPSSAHVPSAPLRARAGEDLLLEEIKQMKEMMIRLSLRTADDGEPPFPEEIRSYYKRLLDHEVEPDLAKRIIRKAAEEFMAEDSPKTEEFAFQAVKKQLKEILKSSRPKALAQDTRIAHFVGPTGVGKTTTIAKLAAEQVLKYNRKVGFITSDTYRIAAIEQLKTYATILNVPLEVVFSPQELNRAFQQMQDRDIIFMDTAGRNFRNAMYVSELNSLLQSGGKSETFLVLSLTSKYKDMKAITDNFAKFTLDKVLFTKMDETRSYGSIVNLLYDFPIQLSYITNGQNVPDDIMIVNEDQLIDRILEELD